MRSAIYTANGNAGTIAIGGIVPVGNIVRRFGCGVDISGNGIETKGSGYYKTTASISFNGTGAGTATIQLYKDGVPVPGALAIRTVAANTAYTIDLVGMTRNYDNNSSILTLVLTGASVDVTNVAMLVEKE